MGEAKRRKKSDPSWGKNQLIEYVKAKTQEKGRGILLFSDFTCEYLAKEEFIKNFVDQAPSNNKRGLEAAAYLIDNYNLEHELVSLATASNMNEINVFCDDLNAIQLLGKYYKKRLKFL